MNVNEMTVGDFKRLAAMVCSPATDHAGPWKIGEKYLIRCVTNYLTGRLKWVGPLELVIEDAAWVADTGRFHDCVTTGSIKEVEPFGTDVIVGRGAIVDAAVWTFDLPRKQK